MQYLIWSNEQSRWWRGHGRGYTHIIEEAGRYSKEEADEIVADANKFIGNAPHMNEVAVIAPETEVLQRDVSSPT